MRLSDPLRHAGWAGLAALVAAALVLGLARFWRWPLSAWGLLGWLLATGLGMICGARLVTLHGRPGSAFLIAHGSCILARLFAFAGGTAWAASHSKEEAWAFLVGVAAAYLPIQILELVWFARRTKDGTS